ncbi:CVNH domain-containing protein [Quisquiliibacterium transsilvanicum]|uniref:Cyanovirin-N domain-containing protein n=1 Tax=Quisquiliibacterium transsilvanicum TaxID=1549638 RepID=A0A7W8HE88_9BURK|nr:CVNH domain-containing protein [Quisquiliibacterium transsilvanicum]MBB5270444.1 hypothetical protein [Quisquiliibacterium transsilvanicum]
MIPSDVKRRLTQASLFGAMLLLTACGHQSSLPGTGADAVRWQGSFQTSCREAEVDSAGNLRATCISDQGRWERSFLSDGTCRSHRAGNRGGRLVCEANVVGDSGDGSVSQVTWSGSFRGSCRDIEVAANGDLRATCRNSQGRWESTFMSEGICGSHRAGNRDGRLVCEP